MKINKQKLKPKLKQKLSGFKITEERQKIVYQQIRENAKSDFDFYVLLVFSTIIIALGLVINSAAVVIGGMLIAPLVWPILSLALSIMKGRSRFVGDSVITIFKSSLIILLVSIIVGLLVPNIVSESQEIFSRTQPQLYELFIALASGFIGAFIVSYPKLGGAMAGVVVAAALVPPLSAVGLLIADRDIAGAGGAFLLYISNLIAITLTATLLFFLSRFRGPQTEEAQLVQRSNIRWTILFLLIIIIPLVFITSDTVKLEKRKNVVEEVIRAEAPNTKIQNINIEEEGEIVLIEVTLRSDQNIYKYQVEELTEILSKSLDESIILKITVIPVIEAGKLLPTDNSILNSVNGELNGSSAKESEK